MADVTSDQFQALIEATLANTRALSKLTSSSEKIAKDDKRSASKTTSGSSASNNHSQLTGDAAVIKKLLGEQNKLATITGALTAKIGAINNAATKATQGFQNFSAASGSAAKSINAFMPAIAKVFGAGGVIGLMADALGKTTDTYREMMQSGQSFNGSMLQMQIAAANAALPLNEFAEVVKKNSTVMATIGTKAFGDMSKQLRVSLKDVGQLGLTTAQLNQNLGAYLETQRLYGNLSNQSTEKATNNMRALGIETLKAAQLTGMNSAAITEASNKAMQDETLRAKMLQMGAASVDSYSTTMNKAMVYMAALPGEAGKTLSTMLAQTAGRGSALMTDGAQTFIDAGMFGVTDLMDNMSKKIAAGTWTDQDAAEFNRKFVAEGKKNLASLQMQAASGNEAAKKAIVMISEMEEISKKNPEDLAKQKGITNFLLNLGSIIERVSGLIRERFYKGLESLMTKFEGFTDSPTFAAFSDKIGDMAERFGNFLAETLTPEKLVAIGGGLASFANFLVQVGSVGLTVVSKVASVFGWLSDKMGVFGAALAMYAAWQVAKVAGGAAMGAAGGAVGRVKNLLGERFNIGFLKDKINPNGQLTPGGVQNAFEQALSKFASGGAIRVIQSGGGGGLLDDLDMDHEKKKGKRGRRGRRGRRMGRGGARINTPHTPHVDLPHHAPELHADRGHALAEHTTVRGAGHPNAPHIEPHGIGAERFHMPEYHDNSISGRLKGAAARGYQMSKSAVVSGLQYGKAGALRAGSMAKSGVLRAGSLAKSGVSHGMQYGRAGLSRAGSLAKSGASRALSLGKTGMSKAGSLMKLAGGGGKLLGGAMTAAKFLGPAAIGGVASMAIDHFMPEGRLKDTASAMANGAAIGGMLGPIGAAVGAGAGAIYANWDVITDTVSSTFKSIKDFDYTGAMKTAGKYLAPLGGALTMGASLIYDNWDTIKDTVGSGFQAIADFDYSGAMDKVGEFLSPIKKGVKAYAGFLLGSWKKVGSFVVNGLSGIKNFIFGGDDKAKTQGADLTQGLGGMFGGLFGGNPDGTPGLPGAAAPMSLTPNAGFDLFGNPVQGSSLVAPKNPGAPETPKVNADHVAAHGASWKEHTLQLQKETLDTKKQLAQLMETLAHGNNQTVGGLRDMINEQQKSNRNLDVLGGSII